MPKWPIFVIAIFSGVFAAQMVTPKNRKEQSNTEARQAVSELKQSLEEIRGSIDNPREVPAFNTRLSPSASGDNPIALMTSFAQSIMQRFSQQQQNYLAELDAIQWDQIIAPERLQKDAGLAESKRKLEQAREIVAKYHQQTYALVDGLPAEIDQLALSDSEKAGMRRGFEQSSAQSRVQFDAVWQLEFDVIAEFAAIVALLDSSAWSVADGQIVFESSDDLQTFNAHMTRIEELDTQQRTIRFQGLENSREQLDHLENLIQ